MGEPLGFSAHENTYLDEESKDDHIMRHLWTDCNVKDLDLSRVRRHKMFHKIMLECFRQMTQCSGLSSSQQNKPGTSLDSMDEIQIVYCSKSTSKREHKMTSLAHECPDELEISVDSAESDSESCNRTTDNFTEGFSMTEVGRNPAELEAAVGQMEHILNNDDSNSPQEVHKISSISNEVECTAMNYCEDHSPPRARIDASSGHGNKEDSLISSFQIMESRVAEVQLARNMHTLASQNYILSKLMDSGENSNSPSSDTAIATAMEQTPCSSRAPMNRTVSPIQGWVDNSSSPIIVFERVQNGVESSNGSRESHRLESNLTHLLARDKYFNAHVTGYDESVVSPQSTASVSAKKQRLEVDQPRAFVSRVSEAGTESPEDREPQQVTPGWRMQSRHGPSLVTNSNAPSPVGCGIMAYGPPPLVRPAFMGGMESDQLHQNAGNQRMVVLESGRSEPADIPGPIATSSFNYGDMHAFGYPTEAQRLSTNAGMYYAPSIVPGNIGASYDTHSLSIHPNYPAGPQIQLPLNQCVPQGLPYSQNLVSDAAPGINIRAPRDTQTLTIQPDEPTPLVQNQPECVQGVLATVSGDQIVLLPGVLLHHNQTY